MFRPFRARAFWRTSPPPGLVCSGPFGAKFETAQHQKPRLGASSAVSLPMGAHRYRAEQAPHRRGQGGDSIELDRPRLLTSERVAPPTEIIERQPGCCCGCLRGHGYLSRIAAG